MELKDITAEKWQFIIDHPEPQKQGIHLWYKGVPYPRRVYFSKNDDVNHFLRTLRALGNVKKLLFSLTFLKGVVIPIGFKLKHYEAFLGRLFGVIHWNLAEFWIKDEEYSVPVWEIGKLIKQFLIALGLSETNAWNYTKTLMMVLEFDNAYRYRIQDLLGEITQLDRGTLKYIYNIYQQREENPGASEKILRILKMFIWLLWIPPIKNALKKANEGVDFSKIALDINDRYHTSFWRGYNFGGKTFDERYQFFLDSHPTEFPPYQKRDEGSILDFLTG